MIELHAVLFFKLQDLEKKPAQNVASLLTLLPCCFSYLICFKKYFY